VPAAGSGRGHVRAGLSPSSAVASSSVLFSPFFDSRKGAAAIVQACTLGFYFLGFSRSFGVAFRSAPQVGRSMGVLVSGSHALSCYTVLQSTC
jgi:hypothetical protein